VIQRADRSAYNAIGQLCSRLFDVSEIPLYTIYDTKLYKNQFYQSSINNKEIIPERH